jgi:hypothetical protein
MVKFDYKERIAKIYKLFEVHTHKVVKNIYISFKKKWRVSIFITIKYKKTQTNSV